MKVVSEFPSLKANVEYVCTHCGNASTTIEGLENFFYLSMCHDSLECHMRVNLLLSQHCNMSLEYFDEHDAMGENYIL